jgi:hypothetical protein
MAQEIELKFIVEKDSVDALRQHLHTLSGEHHEPVQLLNIYYETPDNWLRVTIWGCASAGERALRNDDENRRPRGGRFAPAPGIQYRHQ